MTTTTTTYDSNTVSRETAVQVANQRYWDGVADGLRQADRIAERFGLDKDIFGAISAELERAEEKAKAATA